jgi:DNA-binding SARP family transcriptional activator
MMADELGTGQSFAAAQFGVLGPLQVRMGDQLVPLGTPKQRAVLAMLIINANRP